MEHLGGNNHGLLCLHALGDDAALDAGNLLDGHLDAQVATGNHDAVAGIDDFVDVVHAFLVLNLGYDLDVAVVGVENVLHSLHIGGVAHKRVCDEVDVKLDGKFDVLAVFLGQGRQVDMLPGHVHALVGAQHALVLHLGNEHRSLDIHHLHVEFAVVEEDVVAHLHVGGDVAVAQVHDVV